MHSIIQKWMTNPVCFFIIVLFFFANAGYCLHEEKNVTAVSPVPIVLWHGMGESYCITITLAALTPLSFNSLSILSHITFFSLYFLLAQSN